jgi:hypothetical protein
VLKATGKEKVEFTFVRHETNGEGQTETHRDRLESDKEFFKQKIVLSAMAASGNGNMYMPGKYMYPFEYQLPVPLPGSIRIDGFSSGSVENLSGKIKYKLKATLDVGGFFATDLKADCDLVVHERLFQSIMASEDSTTQDVRFLCCFNKGRCTLSVAMDKNVYLPGETAQIQCVIDNGSTVNIDHMRCQLFQDVTVLLKHHGRQTFTQQICQQEFQGVPAGGSLQQPQPLTLMSDRGVVITPSTTGELISCAYRIVIECDIPWCPDVQLRMPVTIIAPALPSLSWVPTSMEGFVAPS